MATVRDTVRAIGVAVTRSPLLDVLEEADPAWNVPLPGSALGVGDVARALFAGALDPSPPTADVYAAIQSHRLDVRWFLSENGGTPATIRDAVMEFAYHAQWMLRDLVTYRGDPTLDDAPRPVHRHVRDAQKYIVRALELAGVPHPQDVWDATLADATLADAMRGRT